MKTKLPTNRSAVKSSSRGTSPPQLWYLPVAAAEPPTAPPHPPHPHRLLMYKGPCGGPPGTPALSGPLCVHVSVCVTLTHILTSSNFKLNTCGSYHDDRALQALSYLLRRDEERGGGAQERESKERRKGCGEWCGRAPTPTPTHAHRGGQREGSQAESESCCFCISVFFMSRQFTGRLFTVWYLALLGQLLPVQDPTPQPPHHRGFIIILLIFIHVFIAW